MIKTDLTRRGFLGGALTVLAVSIAVPTAAFSFSAPRIYGDGLHDDWEGLQAAFNGKPYLCQSDLVHGTKQVEVFGGNFLLSRPLHIFGGVTVHMQNSCMRFTHLTGEACLNYRGATP